jgi:NADH-quinone oxidoreductase subunit F
MAKLRSIKELRGLRRRIGARLDKRETLITVCAGTACQACGANDIQRVIKRRLIERDLVDRIRLRITGCHGFCEMGPFVVTEPQSAFYPKINTWDVPRIVDALLADEYVEDLLYRDPTTDAACYRLDDIPFFARQHRTLLGKNQSLDPIRLFGYVAQRPGADRVHARADHRRDTQSGSTGARRCGVPDSREVGDGTAPGRRREIRRV